MYMPQLSAASLFKNIFNIKPSFGIYILQLNVQQYLQASAGEQTYLVHIMPRLYTLW